MEEIELSNPITWQQFTLGFHIYYLVAIYTWLSHLLVEFCLLPICQAMALPATGKVENIFCGKSLRHPLAPWGVSVELYILLHHLALLPLSDETIHQYLRTLENFVLWHWSHDINFFIGIHWGCKHECV